MKDPFAKGKRLFDIYIKPNLTKVETLTFRVEGDAVIEGTRHCAADP